MKLNRLVVAVCAVALAVPAAVLANGPGTHPNSHANTNHVNQRCKHQPMVGYTYGGKLDATSTASNLVINVTHASHWAKSLKGTQFAVTGANAAKAKFSPASPFDGSGNPNAGVDLTKDTVQVVGKVGKPKHGCTFANSVVTVRHLSVNGPDQTEQAAQSA